ncbi:MAG: phospholipase D-like domain-containing protein, partial [Anaerolineae bacterium]|nr:phospholipase D-like domain-containing protein [Anaerolineae bacterium]
MTRRARRVTGPQHEPPSARALALIGLVALAVVVAVLFGVPEGLWRQPGAADLRHDLLLALGFPPPQTESAPTPTATPPWFQVHFTTPRYPDDESSHQGGIDQHLVGLIDAARESIDVAAYELDLETVSQALLRAKGRGVSVRVVTDTDNLEEEAIRQLKDGGIPVVADERGAIMHDKFVIVDGEYV